MPITGPVRSWNSSIFARLNGRLVRGCCGLKTSSLVSSVIKGQLLCGQGYQQDPACHFTGVRARVEPWGAHRSDANQGQLRVVGRQPFPVMPQTPPPPPPRALRLPQQAREPMQKPERLLPVQHGILRGWSTGPGLWITSKRRKRGDSSCQKKADDSGPLAKTL